MRTAILLVVLCAFACLGSATAIKKSKLRSNSTMEVLTRDNFAASCNSFSFSGSTISASCRNKGGSYVRTSYNIDDCIGNTNGVFTCGGAYSRSAQSQRLSGTVLNANLQTSNGRWVQTSVNLNSFLSNTDGKLTCDCTKSWNWWPF